jgi:hypothetical protein
MGVPEVAGALTSGRRRFGRMAAPDTVYYSCLDFFACREDFYAVSLIRLSGLAFAAASSAKIVVRAGASAV